MLKLALVFKNEEGALLIAAVVVMVLLGVIGMISINSTRIELEISRNYLIYSKAYYAANAGIEVGRAALNDLKVQDIGSWDDLLAGVNSLDDVIDTEGGRNIGSATFYLHVMDNNDFDNNSLVDTDDLIILTSTGSYRNAQVEIVADVHYIGGDPYAQEHYNARSTGEAQDSGPVINNY